MDGLSRMHRFSRGISHCLSLKNEREYRLMWNFCNGNAFAMNESGFSIKYISRLAHTELVIYFLESINQRLLLHSSFSLFRSFARSPSLPFSLSFSLSPSIIIMHRIKNNRVDRRYTCQWKLRVYKFSRRMYLISRSYVLKWTSFPFWISI